MMVELLMKPEEEIFQISIYCVHTRTHERPCTHTHTYKQGQGFLSCHYVCLTEVSICSSYEYEQKIEAINGINKYALSHWYFNTFSTFVKRVCLILKYSYITDSRVVEALRYKPESRGFDSQWCHWKFSLT